jgi:hypothetical protein
MKKIALIAVAGALLATVPAHAQSTNLVKNGGFATTTTTAANGNFELTTNNTYGSVANWTTAGGYNLLFNTGNAATTAGNAYGQYTYTGKEYLNFAAAGMTGNFLALDGDPSFAGAVSQSIVGLVAGQTYTLSFDWSGNQIASRTGATLNGLTASIGGNSFSTASVAQGSGAQHASYNFTYKAGASNVLSFLSNGSPVGLPPVALLDNVSLSAVPEPATWATMLIGVGLVGGAMRVRRRRAVAAVA